MSWLVAASLFFYGWWNPAYLGLITASVVFNYLIGSLLENHDDPKRKWLLTLGIASNLGLISYYKYANFFVNNLNEAFGSQYHLQTIILPLGISFFTFQQIAYLVDVYQRKTQEHSFLHYSLFVTFFPQLIAGPIVHHKEMLPQFAKDLLYKINAKYLAIGISVFTIGLFKKIIIADNAALAASPIFSAAETGNALSFFDAWGGSLAYTCQLYFDFSGYSDMAIGIALMFGIVLPINFNSPYKATNIIEFWRRWHMTLSRFLRDYLYIPLGGNRKGKSRRYINILITMLLGGLWHGAGWTFIAWGGLHGVYLIINHLWHSARVKWGQDINTSTLAGSILARIITFIVIVVAWVFFRAESFGGALNVLSAMAGFNNLGEISSTLSLIKLSLVILILMYAPNTQEIVIRSRDDITSNHNSQLGILKYTTWQPRLAWSLLLGTGFFISVLMLETYSEFIYFQF